MKTVHAAVLPPETPPPQGTRLVLFSDPKPYISKALAAQMLSRAVRYAKRHGVFTVPQRFLADGYLCLCLVGPNGVLYGAQRATHINLDYRDSHLHRADGVVPFDTPLGRVGLLVDVDFSMPHVARQAAAAGADMLIASQFVQPYDFYEERLVGAVESAAHSNGIPVVAAMSGYGAICRADENAICSPFEDVPVAAAVSPAHISEDMRASMAEATALLRAYGELFTQTGGDDDER